MLFSFLCNIIRYKNDTKKKEGLVIFFFFFPNNLKRLRKERNLTQEQLAKISGVSRVAIARYEREQQTPKQSALEKLATALGVSVYDLTNDNNFADTTNIANRIINIPSSKIENGFNLNYIDIFCNELSAYLKSKTVDIFSLSDSKLMQYFAEFLEERQQKRQEAAAGASSEKE